MTNEERIYELCDCLIMLIDLLPHKNIEYLKENIKDIKQDIDNNWN